MVNRRLAIVTLLTFLVPTPLLAAEPLAFSVDEETQSYTITEQDLIDAVGLPVICFQCAEAGLNEALIDQHQKRCGRHAQRHGSHQRIDQLGTDHVVLDRKGEQDEGKFTALGQCEGEQ